uniref:NADH dehydrogenase [ubiquinone] 1 subunit C2 n=1 Tax=Heliothis virescens TaxID=7102 RepID=A0A2A4K4U1_HELVI
MAVPDSQLSAIELLNKGNEGREVPVLNKHWTEILGATFGLCMGIFLNHQTRRPAFSGIQKHVLLGAGFIGLFNFVQDKRNSYLAEKDAVFRHYVSLHPEDFPEPPRKKIADIIEPWVPVR